MPLTPCLRSSHVPGDNHDPVPPTAGQVAGPHGSGAGGLPPGRRTPGAAAAPGMPAARNAIPAHKRVPYLPRLAKIGPQAGQPRMRENLNGAVAVAADAATPHSGTPVLCRHLAQSYIQDRQFLDLAAQSPWDLHDYYSGGRLDAVERQHDEWLHSPAEAQQVVGNRQFGRWLADIAAEMGRMDKTCAEALLCSPDHAMAVRIQHKSRRSTGYIRVSCYDPNGSEPGGTGNHIALEVSRPAELGGHSMRDFFTRLGEYVPGGDEDAACVGAICPAVPLPTAGPPPYLGRPGPQGRLPPAYALALFVAVGVGLREPLRALCQLLAAQGVTASQALPALLAKDSDGFSALHRAADRGLADAFTGFAQALQQLGVPADAAVAALLDKDPHGFSALHHAASGGHTQAFIDFARALQHLGITGHKGLCALLDEDRHGSSALQCAAEEKHPGAFVNFAKALRILGIAGDPAWHALLGEAMGDTTPIIDLVKRHGDRAQLKDLQDAVAVLREPPA